jgi:hypothetical protein
MKKAQIIQITAPMNIPMQGDTDYTETLTACLRQLGIDAHYPKSSSYNPPRYKLLSEIHGLNRNLGVPQILHLQLRPPTGTTLNPEDFKKFDYSVVTLHEFTKLSDIRAGTRYGKAGSNFGA